MTCPVCGYSTSRLDTEIATLRAEVERLRAMLDRTVVDLEAAKVVIEHRTGERTLGLRQTLKIARATLAEPGR